MKRWTLFNEPMQLFTALAVILGGVIICVFGPDVIAELSYEGSLLWMFGEYIEWLARIFGFIVGMFGAYLFVRAI